MAKVTGAATARNIESGSETRSDHKIKTVETYRLKLPYRNAVAFKSVKEAVGEYVILRLVLDDGPRALPKRSAAPRSRARTRSTSLISSMLISSRCCSAPIRSPIWRS